MSTFREMPIEEAFEREVKAAEAMLSPGETLTRLTRQNIQARIRGMRMWNWANASRGMWLQTGNMSEKAVGYTTIGGDLMGAYSLLGNLPKTIVIRLLDYLREKHGFEALEELMKTEASAELEENQEDERDLMPFPVLDACFALFAGEKMMPVELYRAIRAMWTDEELREMRPDYRPGMLKEWVKRFCRLFVGSIFKWVQAPAGGAPRRPRPRSGARAPDSRGAVAGVARDRRYRRRVRLSEGIAAALTGRSPR